MEEEQEAIFRDGVIWVSPKLYIRQIKECKELLAKDLSTISSLKKPKPKGWIKIRNKINHHLRWIKNKHIKLEYRADALISYSKHRVFFRHILDNQHQPD